MDRNNSVRYCEIALLIGRWSVFRSLSYLPFYHVLNSVMEHADWVALNLRLPAYLSDGSSIWCLVFIPEVILKRSNESSP